MQPRASHDPALDRDACGVGFVAAHRRATSRARSSSRGSRCCVGWPSRGHAAPIPRPATAPASCCSCPHRFFKREGLRLGFDMPHGPAATRRQVFLPPDPAAARARASTILEEVDRRGGPARARLARRADRLRRTSAAIARARAAGDPPGLRRARAAWSPTRVRAQALRHPQADREPRARARRVDPDGRFHVASLSAETIVYKGLLLPAPAARASTATCRRPDFVSAIALVHSRFSTNTFPTWDLAQPFRYIAHNGEINTLRGNRNWMQRAPQPARVGASSAAASIACSRSSCPGKSDSAQFDNMLELLHLGGRSAAARDDDDDPGGVGGEPGRSTGADAASTATPRR